MAESKFACEIHTGESEGLTIKKSDFWKRFHEEYIDPEQSKGEFDAVTRQGKRFYYRQQGENVVVVGATYEGLGGFRHLQFPKYKIDAWELLGWFGDLFGQAENHPPGFYKVNLSALDPEQLEEGLCRFVFESLPFNEDLFHIWADGLLKLREDYWD